MSALVSGAPGSLWAAEKAKGAPKGDTQVSSGKLADASIVTAWTRAAEAGSDTHVFLTVENKGPAPIFLKGGKADVATAVQLVKFEMLGAYMRTRLIDPVAIDPQGRYVFEPGVIALELRNLKADLRKGDSVPMKIVFANLGEIDVNVEIDSRSAVRYEAPAPDAIPPAGTNKSGH